MPRPSADHHVAFEPSPKHIRVVSNGKTVADSLCAGLLLETGQPPVYYFSREDVCAPICWNPPITAPKAHQRRRLLLDTSGRQPRRRERCVELRAAECHRRAH